MAFDGKNIILKVNDTTVLGQTAGGYDLSAEPLETTDKLSKDPITGITHKTYILGDRDGTVTLEGNTKDDIDGWPTLFGLYASQVTPATIYYGGEETGEKFYTQSGWLTSVSRTDNQNTISTYSATFQKSGAPTESTVAP
jgi:hypothetical protein